jgi:hypothetical protein
LLFCRNPPCNCALDISPPGRPPVGGEYAHSSTRINLNASLQVVSMIARDEQRVFEDKMCEKIRTHSICLRERYEIVRLLRS